jgi:hypothetical protein
MSHTTVTTDSTRTLTPANPRPQNRTCNHTSTITKPLLSSASLTYPPYHGNQRLTSIRPESSFRDIQMRCVNSRPVDRLTRSAHVSSSSRAFIRMLVHGSALTIPVYIIAYPIDVGSRQVEHEKDEQYRHDGAHIKCSTEHVIILQSVNMSAYLPARSITTTRQEFSPLTTRQSVSA